MVDDKVWEEKDLRIVRQSCIGYATKLLEIAVENNMFTGGDYESLLAERERLTKEMVKEVYEGMTDE